jgi:hypothetical protein
MIKFNWIDFGYSWKESWVNKPVDMELHASTACLVSKILRGRPFQRRKIFVWLRTEKIIDVSETNGVVHIEIEFPFTAYVDAEYAERLQVFAHWMVMAISNNFPDFLPANEVDEILRRLSEDQFTYVREDVVKIASGTLGKCKVTFRHSPERVEVRIDCPGAAMPLDLPRDIYRRDELDYGRSVESCAVYDGIIIANTTKGSFDNRV